MENEEIPGQSPDTPDDNVRIELPPELAAQAASLTEEVTTTAETTAKADNRVKLATTLAGQLVLVGCAAGCPNWNVQPAEQEQLSAALGAVLAQYIPKEAGADLPPWLALAVTAGMIAGPRIAMGIPRHAPEEVPA